MKKSEMELLTDEELIELSLRKNKSGCYSRDANLAMEVRRERSGHWCDVMVDCTDPEVLYQGKKFS